jgi:hypothetical protein
MEMVGWPPPPESGRAEGMRDTTKRADRLAAIRLRYTINSHLDRCVST